MKIHRLLVSACIIVLVLLASGRAYQLVPYLTENYSPLDINNLDLSMMAQDLETNDVFLSGAQWHGTQANYELLYSMTTALHQQAGVNYLLMASGHATAAMYNSFLETGDQNTLDIIHEAFMFTNGSNNEHRVFWRKLYEYNKSQPEDNRIIVIGIDVENLPRIAVHYLTTLPGADQLPLIFPSGPFRPTAEQLDYYVTRLRLDFLANEAKYRDALGDSFNEFKMVLNNLTDTVTANQDRDTFYEIREEIMYKNFLEAYNRHPQGKFFGQLTMEHIYQQTAHTPRLDGADSLAKFMNDEDSPVRGKVISIASTYVDSIFRFCWGRYYNMEIYEDYLMDLNAFRQIAETDFTLFRLTGQNSPFTRDLYTIKNPTNGVTTDYYQYLLVIRNSQSASPNIR